MTATGQEEPFPARRLKVREGSARAVQPRSAGCRVPRQMRRMLSASGPLPPSIMSTATRWPSPSSAIPARFSAEACCRSAAGVPPARCPAVHARPLRCPYLHATIGEPASAEREHILSSGRFSMSARDCRFVGRHRWRRRRSARQPFLAILTRSFRLPRHSRSGAASPSRNTAWPVAP